MYYRATSTLGISSNAYDKINIRIELHTLLNKVLRTLLAFFLNENPLYHPKSMWNDTKQSRFTM